MNILFLVNEYVPDNSGVSMKIQSQFAALRTASVGKVYLSLISREGEGYQRRCGETVLDRRGSSIFSYYSLLLSFATLTRFIADNEITLIYIRHNHFANPCFIKFLKQITKSGVLVLLEIPTYPYDSEYRQAGFAGKAKLCVDKHYRHSMSRYVDRIITLSNDEQIWGCATYQMSNAAPVQNMPVLLKVKKASELRFVGVAKIMSWHGYDRLIEGIAQYYNDETVRDAAVYFDVIGDGPELARLKALVSSLSVENYVSFHGYLSGDSLYDVIRQCDIGVDSLGRHRSGLEENNSLKSKEFLVLGKPIIKSHRDSSIDIIAGNVCLDLPSSEEAVDIKRVLDWYVNQVEFGSGQVEKFREEFSWDRQMQRLLGAVSRLT